MIKIAEVPNILKDGISVDCIDVTPDEIIREIRNWKIEFKCRQDSVNKQKDDLKFAEERMMRSHYILFKLEQALTKMCQP